MGSPSQGPGAVSRARYAPCRALLARGQGKVADQSPVATLPAFSRIARARHVFWFVTQKFPTTLGCRVRARREPARGIFQLLAPYKAQQWWRGAARPCDAIRALSPTWRGYYVTGQLLGLEWFINSVPSFSLCPWSTNCQAFLSTAVHRPLRKG